MTDSESGSAPSRPRRGWLRALWSDRVDPNTYLGLHLTVALAVALSAIWLFSTLLDAILDNDALVRWDMAADLAIHQRMTAPSLRIVDMVTQLGSPIAMVLVCLIVAGVLWRRGVRSVLWGWLAAFVGGAAVGQILKLVVHRTRPVYGAAYLHGNSFSFPSGHAMGSVIGYGMCVYLVRHVWHARPVRRRLATLLAVLLILAIGTSRILLGVHYPSDVVGGWAAGLAWMTICISGIGIAQQRRLDRTHPASADVLVDAQRHPAS